MNGNHQQSLTRPLDNIKHVDDLISSNDDGASFMLTCAKEIVDFTAISWSKRESA